MRQQTRHYTSQLPRLTLAHLRELRRLFGDGVHGLQMETASGKVTFRQEGDSYATTVGGRTLTLHIATTQAGYGVRYWFLCPHCGSRRAKLHVGKRDIACRECWGIHYASQSEDRLSRMRRHMYAQRAEIWGNYGPACSLFNCVFDFPKPKGMRWVTFNQKVAKLAQYENSYWLAMRPVVDRTTRIIERKVSKATSSLGIEL